MNVIAIPVVDRYSKLKRLLDSLYVLEQKGWVIVLSLDMPFDPTLEHLFLKRTPVDTLWSKTLYGVGWNHYRAINHAFNKLHAETVCVIDADMELTADGVHLLEWFAKQDKYLGLSLLSPRFQDGYITQDNALVTCKFFSRFQLTCHRDMWYKYIQPVWMRSPVWDEPFTDVVEDSGRLVVHPEQARVICNGMENSSILSMEEHEHILGDIVTYTERPVSSYVIKDGIESIRR